MDACQVAVYQMKCTPAYRQMRFHPYRELQDKGIRVGYEDYVQAYLGHMHPQETPEDIRHRLCKQLPRNFHGQFHQHRGCLCIEQGGNRGFLLCGKGKFYRSAGILS